jgi:hypothetical protein
MDTNLKLHLSNDKNLITRTKKEVIKVNFSMLLNHNGGNSGERTIKKPLTNLKLRVSHFNLCG